MNVLVVYDTAFGNTAQIARAVASGLERFGPVQMAALHDEPSPKLEGVDLLVVGSPTQNHRDTLPVEAWLEKLEPHVVRRVAMAAFDTRYKLSEWFTGSAARRLYFVLLRKGALLRLPPESFFVHDRIGPLVEGELERAERWAMALGELVCAPDPMPGLRF